MTTLVAILSKQVQLQELVACIDDLGVTRLFLYLTTDRGRINVDGIGELLDEICPSLEHQIGTLHIKDRAMIIRILKKKADIVAMTIYNSSAMYPRIPLLRLRGGKVVHVTDGLGDLFTKWELQRAVLAKTTLALAKGIAVIPILSLCRADVEYNLFHPAHSPYARTSLPVGRFPMTVARRGLLSQICDTYRPRALVIDGFDLDAKAIADGVGLESYVATRRDGGILINGRQHLPDQVICAEEMIDVMRPEMVIGCPSTALVAARWVHRDLPVFCITTPEAIRLRGPRFNAVFKDYACRYGVVFAKSDAVVPQFKELKAAIAQNLPAAAATQAAATHM